MFGRGAWAIFGLGKDSLETFRTLLEDQATMVTASQLAASAVTRHFKCPIQSASTRSAVPASTKSILSIRSTSRSSRSMRSSEHEEGSDLHAFRRDLGLRGLWVLRSAVPASPHDALVWTVGGLE